MKYFPLAGICMLGVALLSLTACDSIEQPEENATESIVDALFAPATASERNMIEQEWALRDVSTRDIREEKAFTVTLDDQMMRARIVSHVVDGNRHYGAIVVPDVPDDELLPVLMYLHGGDEGENLDFTLPFLTTILGDDLPSAVLVVPSFRSEPITFGDTTFTSEGSPSLWDKDVDDTLALLNVTLETTPRADENSIGFLGFSRGAGVGLLAAARDARVKFVINFYGPTHFFVPDIESNTRDALEGVTFNLVGFDFFNDSFLQPLRAGTLTTDNVRLELIRRSVTLFADKLPAVQIHHGEDDDIVSVAHAEVLRDSLTDLGRTPADFETFLYPGAGHNVLQLTGSIERAILFINNQYAPNGHRF